CIACPDPAPCSCGANEQCVLINRDCNTCSINKCIPNPSGSKGGGVSGGAVAGAVIASLVFLAAVVGAFIWYRRRSQRAQQTSSLESKPVDVPARAEEVLAREDPNEKADPPAQPDQETGTLRIYGGNSTTTINLDPEMQNSSAVGTPGHSSFHPAHSNPFDDAQSIQTTSTGTQSNVIPIALVAPAASIAGGSQRSDPSHIPSTQATAGTVPARPARDPQLDISTDPNGSPVQDSLRSGTSYAPSAISGATGLRNSYMSTGSFASDLLSEPPVIITQARGAVKQVLGTAKAEVIRTAGSSVGELTPPHSANSLHPPVVSRPSTRSPLAANSFGPGDVVHEGNEGSEGQEITTESSPFGDEHSPYIVDGSPQPSPVPTQSSFGNSADPSSQEEDWTPADPRRPWATGSGQKRPDSVSTQAQSIIGAEISGATRVNVGLNNLAGSQLLAPSSSPDTPVSAALSSPRSPYRMTSAKLIAPSTAQSRMPPTPSGGTLEQAQKRAMEELNASQRMSSASVASTSTRADSILEGFPFVPPSPISDRPLRTPPRSPLAQQAATASPPRSPLPPSPQAEQQERDGQQAPTPAPAPAPAAAHQEQPKPRLRKRPDQPPPTALNNRKLLGMSVASQSSTLSNGLGSFPFQIDSGVDSSSMASSAATPSTADGRQRASLDTLALTSDLSSYPLGFD
ncbi:hypothetical protein K474DRAFT_1579816, partial [Panus rudis PR-1116 ss-1]